MPKTQTQISAIISTETKKLLEEYAITHGIKKGYLVESALLHHLAALQVLPTEVIVSSRLKLTKTSGDKVLKQIKNPPKPTEDMIALFEK